jgi:hypothetical protein
VPNPKCRVPCAVCRVPSPESRVPSPESRVPSPESRVPSPESRVPSPESRVPELRTWDLIFETGQRYLSKCENQILLISSNFCPKCQVPNPEPRVPSSEFRDSELGTQNSGLRTWYLRLDQKCENQMFLISSNFCPKCQVLNPEPRVPSSEIQDSELGTWNSELRTRDSGLDI